MNKTSRSVTIIVVLLLVINLVSVSGAAQDNTDALVSGLMSFLVPGAGQLINDEPDKAIVHFGVFGGIWIASSTIPYFFRFGLLADFAWRGYSGYEAYQVARGRKNRSIFSSLSFENEKRNFQKASVENLGLSNNEGLSLARLD